MGKACRLLPVLLTAMALAAPAASAQMGVEVRKESPTGNTHCQAVQMALHLPVMGNCKLRVVSEGDIRLFQHNGASEVLFSVCSHEFEVVFGETGAGHIYNQQVNPPGGVCGREPCDESENSTTPHRNQAWSVELFESGPADEGKETMRTRFCLYPYSSSAASEGTPATECMFDLYMTPEAGHEYEIWTLDFDGSGNGGSPCFNQPIAIELAGHWVTERNAAHPDSIEVIHQND